eukprot:09250.XXX_592893_593630_1 [CDS] Oithona nana genome sequencing.
MNTIDAYSHDDVDPRIFYSPTNVTNCDEVIDFACACKESCQPNTCLCLQYSGHQLNYNHFKIVPKNSLLFECRRSCACPPNCGNKLVQNGPRNDLVTKDFGQKGLGLVSQRPIGKGTFVCEYAGEIITKETAERRSAKDLHNYILHVFEHFNNKKEKVTIIDPTAIGNIGRYLNHSCQPNLSMHLIRCEDWTPHVALFANTDIEPNVELTFDYGQGQEQEVSNGETRDCLCGSDECRKVLPSHQL